MESKKYSLNKTDLKKVGKGALIALGGALAVYVAQTVKEIDFGAYTPVVVALVSILINALNKFIEGPAVEQ